jgi:hypothetical protein
MSAHCYRVVVEEQLGPRYASAFDGTTLSPHDDRTEITGLIARTRRLHIKPARVVDEDPGTNQKGPT